MNLYNKDQSYTTYKFVSTYDSFIHLFYDIYMANLPKYTIGLKIVSYFTRTKEGGKVEWKFLLETCTTKNENTICLENICVNC